MKFSSEREGELFAIAEMLVIGAMPIFMKVGLQTLSPIFFAGTVALLGAILLFPFALKQGLAPLFSREYGPKLFLLSILGTGFANLLFLYGASMTSAINASILLQIEIVYSILISYLVLREKITTRQLIFTSIVFLGTLMIMFNGKPAVNLGDILVIISPFFYQLSHMLAKQMPKLHPFTLSFARTLYPGIILTPLAFLLMPSQFSLLTNGNALLMIAIQSVFGIAIGFPLWYFTIQRINLSKATAILLPYPVISLLLAFFWLGETPSIFQLSGLALAMLGIYLLTSVKSEKR